MMRLIREISQQLNFSTLSLFGCALFAGPMLAILLGNDVYYWDMLYCLSFMVAALIYTAGKRASTIVKASERADIDQKAASSDVTVKWLGYAAAFAIVTAASILFSKPQSTIFTKLTYLSVGVILPVALFWSFRWLQQKVNGSEI